MIGGRKERSSEGGTRNMIPPTLNKTVIPPGRLHHPRPDEVQRLLEADPDSSLSRHPLYTGEPRVLNDCLAERKRLKPEIDSVFVSERCRPLSGGTVWALIQKYAQAAGLGVHPTCCTTPAATTWPTAAPTPG